MSEPATALDPQRLLDLLRRQREMYLELKRLSVSQRELIADDRPDVLLGVLSARQTIVSNLLRLNGELAPFRRDWNDLVGSVPAELRDEAARLLADINGLLRDILESDQQDSAALSARRQMVARNLSELSGGRVANTAYGMPSASSAAEVADFTG